MSKVKTYKWKDSKSKSEWLHKIYQVFGHNSEEYQFAYNSIIGEKEMVCVFHEKWVNDITVVNDKSVYGLIIFTDDDINNFLVEVGSQFEQQVKQVDTMPESGIFTAVWIEDGFLRSEDFCSHGEFVHLQRLKNCSSMRKDLLERLPSNTVYMTIQ